MRRECFGQGVGNILSSLFGTQGGCALIAQSLLNVGSGGRSRVSGFVMGVTLGLSVFCLAPIMAEIPVAALVGLITLIALNTFAWSSITLVLRINFIDAVVVVLVTVITVWQDLCVAVVIGTIINALGFAWTAATQVKVESDLEAGDKRVFHLKGPLFFGSAMNYKMEVDPHKVSEGDVVLDFSGGKILDISAIQAITEARENLKGAGKRVILRGVPAEALKDLPADVETEAQAEAKGAQGGAKGA
uniref:STAS domain-containing protein n=1 Tax=Alexandrium andersonii TaxID=327968 RepID=A0A7S2N849_9DINO|mmetsp:Transcript_8709/g.19684  ORF Transcript_8709/g.19684 Transcript_8709/m.19684 type:complete len:246 (+) Transcript_8709:2-739(+)